MKSIYKYTVSEDEMQLFSLSLTKGAKILTVQIQYNVICIWVVTELGSETETRWFKVIGTGHNHEEIETDQYIGTFQLLSGKFIGHLFEISNPLP